MKHAIISRGGIFSCLSKFLNLLSIIIVLWKLVRAIFDQYALQDQNQWGPDEDCQDSHDNSASRQARNAKRDNANDGPDEAADESEEPQSPEASRGHVVLPAAEATALASNCRQSLHHQRLSFELGS